MSIIATAPVPAHARLDTADTRDLALTAMAQATPTGGHPAWEVDCIDGDTPLHVSQELTVPIPSGLRGDTVTLSVQVQQNDGEDANLWLDDRTVSADDAEKHAWNILTAVALARRINAERAA